MKKLKGYYIILGNQIDIATQRTLWLWKEQDHIMLWSNNEIIPLYQSKKFN